MQDDPNPGRDHATRAEEDRIQGAALGYLIGELPTQLTLEELIREMARDPGSAAEREAIERAVRDLVAVGLLQRRDAFVVPTRAAVRFEQISI